MARILLGVTGGIAAYKAVELARLATTAGHAVRVIQTEASERFVGRASFAAISGAPVLGSEFEQDPARGCYPGEEPPAHEPISHLELVQRADVYAVVPASANTLAKMAAGLADNLVTTAYLACKAPVLVAPAMNDRMWAHAATQDNVATLRERGVAVVEPGTGALASRGEWGTGRLAEPDELLRAIEQLVPEGGAPRSLDGLRVLVTAGGTREPIDAVRFVGNRSSGRMGFALADEAARRGADVTVVAANIALPRNPAIHFADVETAGELREATARRFPDCDVLIMAAAVSDFRMEVESGAGSAAKIERSEVGGARVVLHPNPDIVAELAQERGTGPSGARQMIVGFAAEHGPGGVERAAEKLARKKIDAIVVNNVARSDIGFDSDENEVVILEADGQRDVPRASKSEVAAAILDWVEEARVHARHKPQQPAK